VLEPTADGGSGCELCGDGFEGAAAESDGRALEGAPLGSGGTVMLLLLMLLAPV
jgi:hypothetical protein